MKTNKQTHGALWIHIPSEKVCGSIGVDLCLTFSPVDFNLIHFHTLPRLPHEAPQEGLVVASVMGTKQGSGSRSPSTKSEHKSSREPQQLSKCSEGGENPA